MRHPTSPCVLLALCGPLSQAAGRDPLDRVERASVCILMEVMVVMSNIQNLVKDSHADIVALDAQGNPILLVEVKGTRRLPEQRRKDILLSLNKFATKFSIPYIMFVDLDNVKIYKNKEHPDSDWADSPLETIVTERILAEYDPEFNQKSTKIGRVFSHYLERLTEGWLRDIAYKWKSGTPPFSDRLQAIGLAERLNNGTTFSETSL